MRFALKALAAGTWLFFSCLVGCLIALVRWRDSSNGHRFARMAGWGVLRSLGLRVRIVGEEHLLAAQPCVYVANHQSFLDVPVLGMAYPTRTLVVGKKELLRIPFFGLMFYAMGNVLLDRGRARTALASLDKVAEQMQRERFSVWVFPEGHRNAKRPMLPFKKGAFYLALKAGVPVVPIVCGQYTRFVDPSARKADAGVVEIRVLEPIITEGLADDDLEGLVRNARERMEAALAEADAHTQPVP